MTGIQTSSNDSGIAWMAEFAFGWKSWLWNTAYEKVVGS